MYQAFRRGMQSVADNAAAKNYASHLAQQRTASGMEELAGMSAQELASNFPNIQRQSNEFAQEFLSNVKPIPESGVVDNTMHFAGKNLAQAGNFAMQNPVGQMALFSAPMLAPMFMGGNQQPEEQLTPEQIAYMQQQQMQQRGYQ